MSDAMHTLLTATPLLDLHHPDIESLVARRGWRTLSPYDRIGAVYDFVRNEIAFGYNEGDELPASRVLADGIGQCNTKGTLLMALLRAVGLPCRFHGFTIAKPLQKGAITGLAYRLAPQRIIHSWVEVAYEGRWVNLEGSILDAPYLASLQRRFPGRQRFCGYGAATPDLSAPGVEWQGRDTYIQKEGIADDFGIFDSPDEFYACHGSNLSGAKRWIYTQVIRHRMNAQVQRIRAEEW
jgi:transglutaminase-like putative cysteine protease